MRQVPYRLPELIEAVGGRIFVAEGEKDVDRLVVWGLFATCNPGGSGKWRADFAQYFASADVVVIADNDNPGRDHARAVATNVAATAAKVRILELPGLPEKGDFCDWVAAGGTPDQLEELVAEAPLFRSPAPPVGDEITRETIEPHAIANIPPRPWAYGTLLLFGHASVIGAVDGGGKGALAVAIALSIITGQALLNEHVWRTGPVAIITYEDDKTEWDRRIAAACIHYGLDYASVKNQFHFLIRKDRLRIRFAVQSPVGTTYPDSVGIIRHMKEIGTVLLIIDPFNHAHDMEDGNSNTAIAKVAGEVSRIAAESEAAVLVLHHLRKGATGNVDDLMGATALRANFRSCRILTKMTPTEGAKLKLPVNQAMVAAFPDRRRKRQLCTPSRVHDLVSPRQRRHRQSRRDLRQRR